MLTVTVHRVYIIFGTVFENSRGVPTTWSNDSKHGEKFELEKRYLLDTYFFVRFEGNTIEILGRGEGGGKVGTVRIHDDPR